MTRIYAVGALLTAMLALSAGTAQAEEAICTDKGVLVEPKYLKIGECIIDINAMSNGKFFLTKPGHWLSNGSAIGTALGSDASGELLLEDMGAPGKPDVVCSVLFEGTVGPGENGTITKVVDLEGKTPLICTDKSGFCSNPVSLTPLHLPWNTLLGLEGTNFRDVITEDSSGEPGYAVDCNTLIGLVEDVCEGVTDSAETNVTEGVESNFEEKSETASCTLGGAEQGLIEGKLLVTSSGTTLSAS